MLMSHRAYRKSLMCMYVYTYIYHIAGNIFDDYFSQFFVIKIFEA